MSQPLTQIQRLLAAKGSKQNAGFFEKMVPGSPKVYGVKTPDLNAIVVQYRNYSFPLAEELWASGTLEEKIIAIKIMEKKGKEDPARLLKLFKKFSKHIDNWAVCDGLGMQFLRGIVKTHSREIFALACEYNRSKDPWKRRLSLVMLEWYTRLKEHHAVIKQLAKQLENDDSYYVKKAVAWIKRNFEKGK